MGVLCGTEHGGVQTPGVPGPGEGAEVFSSADVALHQAGVARAWGKKTPGS